MHSVTRCRQLAYACGPTVQADKYGDVYIGITPSVCHPFHVPAQYLLNCSTFPLFFNIPNLVWWCIILRWGVMQKNWFTVFNVKVTARAYIIKIWLFVLYLLNCWSVCNQTWFGSTASKAGVACGKIGFLNSRSRSQWQFKMLVNVCPDDISWTKEHFVIKLGIFRLHHKPECHAEKLFHSLQCQGHSMDF